ncbi:MAG: gliding motility lipoprotein GldD [Bergeyella sp.]|nr:gliding motility lipoprotein GldD [Bergeyella sp.]
MRKSAFFGLGVFFLLGGCAEKPSPKPYGELRLEYPKPNYRKWNADCGYSFEYSDLSRIEKVRTSVSRNNTLCWRYINYPHMKAKIFITYFPLCNDLSLHIKEAEKMVYEHTIKASAIETKSFDYPRKKVYGKFYELYGNTASNAQFYVTDSTKHFVTGNLYFNVRPKPDSLAPAINYIKKDIVHLLSTFEWKN